MPLGGAVIGGAVIGAGSSLIGEGKQADATKYAANETAQSAANSLAFNESVYNKTLGNEQPFLDLGDQAAGELSTGLANGSLTEAYPGGAFSFSGVNEANDPAYQFDLGQGEQAVQRSDAAAGGLISGGAMKDLDQYSQGYASNQYQQSYSNALAAYQQAYQQFETTQGNAFSRLAGVAGLGQNAATQTATSGNAAAGVTASVNTSTANSLAGLATAQGNAGAASTIAAGNSIEGGLNQYANYLAMNPNGSSYNSNQGASYSAPPSAYVSPDQWAAYNNNSSPVGS